MIWWKRLKCFFTTHYLTGSPSQELLVEEGMIVISYFNICIKCGKKVSQDLMGNNHYFNQGINMKPIEKENCAFCGSNSITIDVFQRTGHTIFQDKCNGCGACGPEAGTEEVAAQRWNQRVN